MSKLLFKLLMRAGGLASQAMAILRLPGITGHLYLPNVGNYLLSNGTTGSTTLDGVTGLVLDSAGGVGAELVAVTPVFTSIDASFVASSSGGALTAAPTGTLVGYLPATGPLFVGGKTYQITVIVSSYVSGAVALLFYGGGTESQQITGTTTFTVRIDAGATGVAYLYTKAAGTTLTIGSISAREVTGIPVLQPTTAAKPFERRGTLNILKWSTDWANAVWNKVTAPTDEAFQIISGIPAGTAVTLSCKLSGSGTIKLGYYAGALGLLDDTITLTSTPTRYSKTITTAAAEDLYVYPYASRGYPISTGLVATDPQLEYGTVVTESVPTTTGPASNPDAGKYWLDFDGADDALTRTFPAGYESATVINAAPGGQVTLTGQNIVGAYPITADTYGQIIVKVSSSLTGGQLAVLQAYANSLAGV